MNFSLEKFNKNLFFVALVLLIFRVGHFYNSFVPKPYEMAFVILCCLTLVYMLRFRKITDFFRSIPKRILIAVFILVIAILFGWLLAVYAYGIPSTFNMVLEFGTFSIGLVTSLLILFYTKNDQYWADRYLYALVVPALFGIFALLPALAVHIPGLLAPDGNFTGLTDNVNIISKVLLLPALFFITYSLFPSQKAWHKILYMLAAVCLVALLFWISSRGALLSLGLGALVIGLMYSLHHFQWKKLLQTALIILIILALGFILTPYSRKQRGLDRILNNENNQSSAAVLRNESLGAILRNSLNRNSGGYSVNDANTVSVPVASAGESRLEIWPYYARLAWRHPFGIGPDTHYQSNFVNKNGDTLSSGPHNTYIQIWFWGGWLALFSFLYIMGSAFTNLVRQLRSQFTRRGLALFGILLVLAIAIAFDDSLSLYCFWAILALSLQQWIP
ncbi:MAG: hypothetical protein JWM92_586 [Candidatus Nomurabacteria bacterium]|nr:hypothetical protein [Candidatus Nomurabacteria bacterium]